MHRALPPCKDVEVATLIHTMFNASIAVILRSSTIGWEGDPL
jgi:hypothetical protein